MTEGAPSAKEPRIPPPPRPGYWERLLRLIPVAIKILATFVPHGTVADVAQGGLSRTEVNWPSGAGPMPGKRRRVARAEERIDVRGAWGAQLRRAVKRLSEGDERLATLEAGGKPSPQPDKACVQLSAARIVAIDLIGQHQQTLDGLLAYADEEARAEVTERELRFGRLLTLGAARMAGFTSTFRATLRDMQGKPIQAGELPNVIKGAPADKQAAFDKATREEVRRILEFEIDRLIRGRVTAAEIAPPIPPSP